MSARDRLSPILWHLAASAVFAGLALAWTWPLAIHLHDAVLGTGAGDNVTFVWNFWWDAHALANGVSPFWTPMLFAPLGTSLAVHTSAWLPTFAAIVALPHEDPLAAHNLAVIATVFLNGLCAYGAAYAITRAPAAAIVAGLTFAASPFLTARLHGHFNILSAWGLPLLVMTLARFSRRETIGNAILIAFAIAALAYTEPYYVVFGGALAAIYLVSEMWEVEIATSAASRVWLRALLAIAAVLIVVIAAIALSGGADLAIAGLRISARGSFNLRSALGLVLIAALIAWRRPRVRLTRRRSAAIAWRSLAIGAAIAIALILPLILMTAQTMASGDYASQTYLWRSAPPGMDLGALLLGNPFHPLYGAATRAAYAHFAIDGVESVVWLGIVPMICLIAAAATPRLRAQPEMRRWLLLIAFFFVWSLGPFLRVFGANTGIILPQVLQRVVPIVANARMPGRAFVPMLLGISLIIAFVLADDARARARRLSIAGLAALAILIDYWPAAQPFVSLNRPRVYQALRTQPPGALLDLPLGLRDPFGERGHLDHHALFYQTLHEHPIAGGFVGRLSPRVRRAYEDDPIFGALLADPGSPAITPRADSLACACRYVMMPKDTSPQTRDLVTRVLQLDRIDGDDVRDLYRVTGCNATTR